jgi:hypothetical protein
MGGLLSFIQCFRQSLKLSQRIFALDLRVPSQIKVVEDGKELLVKVHPDFIGFILMANKLQSPSCCCLQVYTVFSRSLTRGAMLWWSMYKENGLLMCSEDKIIKYIIISVERKNEKIA